MKIYIIGIVASGKTTLARKWSKVLNIPFYELDCTRQIELQQIKEQKMINKTETTYYDVVGIGNAIVDVLAKVGEGFLKELNR